MSIVYKRPDSPNFYVTRVRKSARTTSRKRAEEFAKKILTDLWTQNVLGEGSPSTWAELRDAWMDAKQSKATIGQDATVIADFSRWWRTTHPETEHPIRLDAISADLVRAYGKHVNDRASASTANRHLSVVRAMLRQAVKWEWLRRCPNVELYRATLKEPRWLTPEEFERLVAFLPEVVQDMATIAVQTGLRFSNVAGLRWDWISADGRVAVVPATDTKTKRTYVIPFSSPARTVLERRRQICGEYSLVFGRPETPNKPYRTIRYWWDAAMKKSGIPPCRFHDLRHTWASWHLQHNTPARVIQEMGG